MKNRSKIGSGADLAPEAVFELILIQFWLQIGAVLGGKVGSCWAHVGQKIDSWKILKAFKIDQDFQHLSGPSWDQFWNDVGIQKSNQNRSKIGLKSDHEANAKILKIIGRGSVFEDPKAWTSIKIRSKSCPKTILHEEAKAAPENDQRNCQDGPKIDPSWG